MARWTYKAGEDTARHKAVRRIKLWTASAVLLLSTVGVAIPYSKADTVPPSGTPATVSADALPTAQIDGVVWAQVTIGNTVYATGRFSTARPAGVAQGGAGTVTRSNLLAYNITTGKLDTSFVHSLGGSSSGACYGTAATGPQGCSIAVSPDHTMLYVGGTFSTVDGQAHANIAAFNLTTNKVVSGFQGVNNKVRAVAATNSGVYLAGFFTQAGGVSVDNMAMFNKSGAINKSWKVTVDGNVNALTIAQSNKLILAGSFSAVNGKKFWSNAAVNLTSGASITPWASQNDSFPVHDIDPAGKSRTGFTTVSAAGSQIYLGSFTSISGTRPGTFEGRMALSASNGALVWLDDCVGDTYSVYPIGQVLYSASHQHGCAPLGWMPDNPGNRERHHAIAETTFKTGTNKGTNGGSYPSYTGQPSASILNWYPMFTTGTFTGISQAGWSVTGNASYVAYGGEFTAVNGTPQQGLVRFAVKSLAPNKMGPQAYKAGYAIMASPADSTGKSKVRIYVTGDPDNTKLTYKVYRKGTSTLVASKAVTSEFWKGTSWTFTDTGLEPGTSRPYDLVVTDPLGNSRTVDDTTVINDTDSRFKYSGSGWTSSQSRSYSYPDFARGIHYTKTNGDSYKLSFYGSSFKLLGEKATNRGNISVSVDGGTATTVSTYTSGVALFQQPIYQSGTLALGEHTVKVTKQSGTYMDVDAAYVNQDKVIDDTRSVFTYKTPSDWTARTNSTKYNDYGESLHYTKVNGQTYTVKFTGTSFALIGEKATNRGNISVSVDGGTPVTVSAYRASTAFQQTIYSKSGLAAGTHTVTVKKLSGTYMDVDALTYR